MVSETLLQTSNLHKALHLDETVSAVNNVNLIIDRGSLNISVGPSGSSKSTLLSLLGGAGRLMSGEVALTGQSYPSLIEDGLSLLRHHRRAEQQALSSC